jgi:hypothetical protein
MKKIVLGALLLASISVVTSCKKEKIKGCKTSYATNYKSTAEEDDGSCTYESKVIFWQNQTNAGSWSAEGVTALTFYADGKLIGSCAANVYNTSSPTCGGSGQASGTISMGSSSTKSVSYSIKDQTGYVWYTGNISLDGSTCYVSQFN